MNIYLLTWQRSPGLERQNLLDFLDTIPEVQNWRTDAGCILLVSSLPTIHGLGEKIHDKFSDLNFLITPINVKDIWGYTDSDTWYFMREPRPVG